jgi:hypothetical protein
LCVCVCVCVFYYTTWKFCLTCQGPDAPLSIKTLVLDLFMKSMYQHGSTDSDVLS